MEVSGVVYRPLPSFSSGAGIDSHHHCSPSNSAFTGASVVARSRFPVLLDRRETSTSLRPRELSGFRDNAHLDYYSGRKTPVIRGGVGRKEKEKNCTEKTTEKRLKLLKGLSRDLNAFSEMGFGLNSDHDLVDQVQGKIISEAAELLLAQLQQLRAEEKELKMKKKEEKANLKAAQMQNKLGLTMDSSSSSSSDSSDTECREVIDMNNLKNEVPAQPLKTELQPSSIDKEISRTESQPVAGAATITLPSTQIPGNNTAEKTEINAHISQNPEETCFNGISTSCSNAGSAVSSNGSTLCALGSTKKIEVCMGGKCRKSGAASLLEEFQRVVGIEDAAAVVECKCMGKCKDGPNVRVLNSVTGAQAVGVDDSVMTPTTNPLCIGVGLEDVSLIVANFLGGSHKDLGLAAT